MHDFTGGTSGGNWTVNVSSSSVDIDLPSEVADVGICFNPEESVVPLTVGPKQRPPDEVCCYSNLYSVHVQCITVQLI